MTDMNDVATTTTVASGSLFDASKPQDQQQQQQRKINWLQLSILTIPPALTLYGVLTTEWHLATLVLTVAMYLLTGLGITAGYHRLWSHRCYRAHRVVRWILILFGGAAFEGSCKWWSRNHRAHHRYNDTDKDPYAVHNGFWWAHMGWMIYKQDYRRVGKVDIRDLELDKMVQWQHKNYGLVALGVGVLLPTLLAGLWGDFRGGFFFAAMLRIVFVHHATFFVNSLAHYHGFSTYSDLQSAKDSWITAVLTLGEGYHNYHHEFPSDYRNGIRFYHYDPTKWLISTLYYFGLADNLKQYSKLDALKAQLQIKQRQLMLQSANNEFGPDFETLPDMDWQEFLRRSADPNQKLIVIDDFVHDVSKFVDEHPGGRQTLLNFVGTDSTKYFIGQVGTPQVHEHTKLARKLLKPLRIAHIVNRPGDPQPAHH